MASIHVEAENYTSMIGIQKEACDEGGENIGYIHDGDWALYLVDIPVAGEYKIDFRVAAKTSGGFIDIVLGPRSVGSVEVENTGNWQTWTTVSTSMTFADQGMQSIKLRFRGDASNDGYLLNLNWFALTASETSTSTGEMIVRSIPELLSYLDADNVHIKMAPGSYSIDEGDAASGLIKEEVFFNFSGSNTTYDFTDVTLNVNTNIYNEFGNVSTVVIDVTGDNNHLFGLTLRDIGNERPYRSACGMYVTGDNNKIEELRFYIRGSVPYAYGDLFGKGSGYVIKHFKHSALLVKGAYNHLLNCYVEMYAYGHGIFMQGAIHTLVEGCYVKGSMRTTDSVLAERSGSAYDVDFMTVWGWPVPAGYAFSLSEDGIRCYNSGSNGRDTAYTTVKNCTVENMRGGVTIGFSNNTNLISGCTVIGGESAFWPGDDDTVEHCQADPAYATIINNPYQHDKNQEISVTVLHETPVYGTNQAAYMGGSGHDVTLLNSSIQPRPTQQTIQMAGLKEGMRYMEVVEGRNDFTLSSTKLTNWTDMQVILDHKSSSCNVASHGPISNYGSGNSTRSISPVTISDSVRSSLGHHTVDANPATYWTANSPGQWIQYNLGQVRNLYTVMIKWLHGSTRQYRFDIQTANHSVGPWTTVFSGTSQGDTDDFETYCFATQNAQYIRLVGRGNSVDNTTGIVEFDIDLKDRFAMVKSKSDDGNVARNTLDGKLNTRWSALGKGQWIQYDLLKHKTIKGIALAWYRGDTRTSNFDIAVSSHPMGPWTSVYSGTSSGTSLELEDYPFDPVFARFIRITGYGNSQDNANSITEIFINTGVK